MHRCLVSSSLLVQSGVPGPMSRSAMSRAWEQLQAGQRRRSHATLGSELAVGGGHQWGPGVGQRLGARSA
eukprot:12936234-Prorocentrum_lima.AAC.1